MLNTKTAVILFQLGGPDSLESVEPFLYNLFMDPDIIDFPFACLTRKRLAKFISHKRASKVRENYKQIGGKSPILELTQKQANALEYQLVKQGFNAKVFISMRYWYPTIEQVVEEIKAGGFEQAVLLPLYPQFSKATTYSSVNEWNRQIKKHGLNIPTRLICCYPNHPSLIEAFTDNINRALDRFRNTEQKDIDLVFSAHGVPISYIKKGDPYQLQVEETVKRIIEFGKWKSPHTLCFQSKVGPMQWLKPSLLDTVEELALRGRKNLLIIPIAFVTEHIETLHEINIEVRRHATSLGIEKFELMPALNDNQKFIDCLAELVRTRLVTNIQSDTCATLQKKEENSVELKLCPYNREYK